MFILRSSAGLLGLTISILAGCAAQNGNLGSGVQPTRAETRTAEATKYAVPTNYRQLIVRKLKATEYAPDIRRALISRPYEEWMGLFHGGHRPAICVEVFRETLLFSEGRDIWIFGFEDGQIAVAGMAYPGPGCKDLSPLNEVVVKRK